MDDKLSKLSNSLDELWTIIEESNVPPNSFNQQYGWNQLHLRKKDIQNYIINFRQQLKDYGDKHLPEGLANTIDGHIANIKQLSSTSRSYFANNTNYLIHMAPNILMTLNTIWRDIDVELYSYQNIEDKGLAPKSLASRLLNIQTDLSSIEEPIEGLQNKISVINAAHSAAESLPIDLANLNNAKKQLEELMNNARAEVTNIKKEIIELKGDIEKFHTKTTEAEEKTVKSQERAQELVLQCEDAFQITTTKGLAAGFDQKARDLNTSIKWWTGGLLVALSCGAGLGLWRVSAFTKILNENLTFGQAFLHGIMALVLVGGPLWFAWLATQQINQRFRLAEDYSYKSTVTKAFTGFKKQAETFDTSVGERLFNSTLDRLDEMPLRLVKDKDYNTPWQELIDSDTVQRLMLSSPELAKEFTRFAKNAGLSNSSIKLGLNESSKNASLTK